MRIRAAADWRQRLARQRRAGYWTGWVCSAATHLLVVVALGICFRPLDLGESGVLELDVALVPEEMPLETFALADTGQPDAEGEDAAADFEAPALDAAATAADAGASSLSLMEFADSPTTAEGDNAWREFASMEVRLQPKPPMPESSEPAPQAAGFVQGGEDGGQAGPRAEYFGTVARGDRFAFVVDVSSSMNSPSASGSGRSRFHRAIGELRRSIQQLNSQQWFYVILFSSATQRMFDDASVVPQMVRATRGNKQRLRRWLKSKTADGGTDPREALRLALELNPSAVFLLSDGEFNGQSSGNGTGVTVANASVFEIVRQTNRARSPIHTFACEEESSQENLRALAEQTGGQYCFISRDAETRPGTPQFVQADAPGTETPEPPRREQYAAAMLRTAKVFYSLGRRREAGDRCRFIVTYFPETQAAEEARSLLQPRGTR